MKPIKLFSLLLVLPLCAACRLSLDNSSPIKASDNYVTRTIEATEITSIDASQAIRVEYEARPGKPHVEVKVADNVEPYLRVEVKDGRLVACYDLESAGNFGTVVTVYAPTVCRFEASSAATIEQKGVLTADREVKIDASSAASITLASAICPVLNVEASSAAKVVVEGIDADQVDAEASSAASLKLSGKAGKAKLEASSAAHLDAAGLKAQSGIIDESSAGHVKSSLK